MMKVGDKKKFSTTSSDGSTITYHATVVRVTAKTYTVEIPMRVRNLPFPPMGKNPETGIGFRYVTYGKSWDVTK